MTSKPLARIFAMFSLAVSPGQDQRRKGAAGSAQDFLRRLDASQADAEPLVGDDAAEAPAVPLAEVERLFAVGRRDRLVAP